ncbi:MAG: hypothetical protein Q9217_001441 [Psora testacea]
MSGAGSRPPLSWSAQFTAIPEAATPTLKGDKIILPPSALERLLSAATVTVTRNAPPQTSSFDPYNPYSFAAERRAREQLIERQQYLPHPLTFRLVNPDNGRTIYAGIREFSAEEGAVGLSPFLREALGIHENIQNGRDTKSVDLSIASSDLKVTDTLQRITVHVEELPKGSFVKLRPLEAGYDAEDWKALLEQYLRDNFTTLTKGEEIGIPAGKEVFRFLVDGLKPKEEAVSLVDTDLEVDIEPLSEEQARETLQKLARKSQRAPGTKDGSSVGGKIEIDANETGQVRPAEYVDYSIEKWNRKQDLEVELTSLDDEKDLDLFVTPFSQKHRSRPREDDNVFGDVSSKATKEIKIRNTHVEMDSAEALWISVRHYVDPDEETLEQVSPIQYNLRVSSVDPAFIADQDVPMADSELLSPAEEHDVNKTGDVKHQNSRNDLGLCDTCFGPLYVSQYDPDGKALRRRVERKYLTQLLTGCSQPWCRNEYCKTGRKHVGLEEEGKIITSKDASSMIKRRLENLEDPKTPLNFCTDEAGQKRRALAEMVAAEGGDGGGAVEGKGKGKEGVDDGYELAWCIAALQVEGGDLNKARGWLKGFAPTRAETAN